MQSFMEMAYRPGRPNLLTLSKRYVESLERRPQERRCNMRFEIKSATGVTHLAIEGELDAVSVSELRPDLEKLVKGRPTVVEVDLSSPAHGRQLRRSARSSRSTSGSGPREGRSSSRGCAISRWRSSACFVSIA